MFRPERNPVFDDMGQASVIHYYCCNYQCNSGKVGEVSECSQSE
jgi:hypothetical protein